MNNIKKQKKKKEKSGFLNIKCENKQMLIISFISQKIKKNKKSTKNSKKSPKTNKNCRKKDMKCCLKEILSCYSLLKKHQKKI